jgi:hypothetical protein
MSGASTASSGPLFHIKLTPVPAMLTPLVAICSKMPVFQIEQGVNIAGMSGIRSLFCPPIIFSRLLKCYPELVCLV